jgi:molybdopterin-synthase adenylyltransferase
MSMDLTEAERARYALQLALPDLGPEALERIRAARVHVVGAGAVAGPALLYLAQAGIGTIYLDDGADVAAEDAAAWLYESEQVGEPRLFAAMGAVRAASSFVKVRAYGTGVDASATLVCALTAGVARQAAERARLSGKPHVVALADGDGGAVVTVPSGAPCYGCASRPGAGVTPGPAAAAVGALAALELLLMVAGAVKGPGAGRRIDLVLGEPRAQPTARVPGCDCANVY